MESKESNGSGSLVGNSEFNSLPSTENGGAYGVHGGAIGGGLVPGAINVGVTNLVEKNAGLTSPAVGGSSGVIGSGGAVNAGSGLTTTEKKRRGRPRKYDLDGRIRQEYVKSPAPAAQPPLQPSFTLTTTPPPPPPPYVNTTGTKRGRDESPVSGGLGTLASMGELMLQGGGGDNFIPHVFTAHTGQDIAGKILTFAQQGSRGGVCVLSANGTVSNVTIRQPGSSGGLMTYEGRFEILSLMGSYTICEEGGVRSRNGGLSVTLASSDGRVIGGGVAGLLMAATPTQIVVGSFDPEGPKKKQHKPTSPSPVIPPTQVSHASQLLTQTQTQTQTPTQTEANPNSACDWNVDDMTPSPIVIPIDHH